MIVLLLSLILQTPTQITVDTGKQTPISPYIYGINYPDNWIYDWLKEWDGYHQGFTLAREGGNRFSAYNWETNASNAGQDYHNENDDYLAMSNEPGWTVRKFLQFVQPTGAAALLTVPTLGYVSADKDTNMFGDKDVVKTPDFLKRRFLRSYATKPGKVSFPPDTTDRAVYQNEFVSWVESVKSPKSPVWFSLDNEPDFWSHTHSRIHPTPGTFAEIIANNIEYASMIKSVARASLVFGPANYGWQGFRTFQNAVDGKGRDFVDTYLSSMREAGKKGRLLDVFDFHWYPEAMGDGARIIYGSGPEKAGTAAARIQAPRSLWDPTFVETSWITQSLGGKPIRLLPDMSERIAKHYLGTKMAITEYDFGGRASISGALAQADALGVFGRYGLFAACHWGLNHTQKAAFAGCLSFVNFDRHGSRFGDLGLAVSGESPAENSVYASLDSSDSSRLTLVVINKTSQPTSLSIATKGFPGRSVRSFVVRDGVYDSPDSGSARLVRTGLEVSAPGLSITTIEVRS